MKNLEMLSVVKISGQIGISSLRVKENDMQPLIAKFNITASSIRFKNISRKFNLIRVSKEYLQDLKHC